MDVPSPLFATFIVEPPCHTCHPVIPLKLTLKNLNIPISAAKTEGPTQIIQFMGIILDLGKWRQGYPRIRWRGSDLLSPLSNLSGQQHCKSFSHSRYSQFCFQGNPPGRPFLQRIIHLTRGVKKPHHHIKLTTGFYKDIEMWTIPFSSMGNL